MSDQNDSNIKCAAQTSDNHQSHVDQALQFQQSLLAFFDNDLAGMVQRDQHGQYVNVNQRWLEMIGFSQTEMMSLTPEDVIHPADMAQRSKWVAQLKAASRKHFRTTRRYIRKDKTLFWGDVYSTGLYDSQENYTGMISIVVDVSDQKEAIRNLEESENKYRALLNSQNDAVLLHRLIPDGYASFSEVNDIAVKRYGYSREELLQMSILDLAPPELIAEHQRVNFLNNVVQEGARVFESCHTAKDGTKIPVEVSATTVTLNGEKFLLSTARDIRERKTAEEKQHQLENLLRQKYKLEAVGLLAGGIAHNFNNNLGIVLGNIELANSKISHPLEAAEYLKNAKTAILHARNLVRQLLTYSRQNASSFAPISLAQIVEETLLLITSTLPKSVTVSYAPCPQPVTILADASQIQEALINLCNNAVQAMDKKGVLKINILFSQLSLEDIPPQTDCPPGDYACLLVEDSGCGMLAKMIEKIFDPFFTTKAMNEGTGMGLTTVQGIVNQHQGFTRVISEPSEGTTFELYFPLAEPVDKDPEDNSEWDFPGGSERIMLVDDDETLAKLSQAILEDAGYQVTIVTDSQQALAQFKEHSDAFDLLISDQTMPKLTGFELIEAFRQLKPQLPAILCTGYSSAISEPQASALGINAFCLKPIEMSDFLTTIRSVLDAT